MNARQPIPFFAFVGLLVAGRAEAQQKIQVMPSGTIKFNSSAVNVAAPPTSITITNVGNAPLTVQKPTLGGTNPGDWSFDFMNFPPPVTLPAGVSYMYNVIFTPAVCAARSATMTITSNDPGTPTVTVDLAGVCGPPDIASKTPASVIVGNERLNLPSPPVPISITNAGSSDLIVTALNVQGGMAGDFALLPVMLPLIIPPNTSQNVSIVFTPTALGNRQTTLIVSNNTMNAPNFSIAIRGTGTMDILSVAPAMLDFGTQRELVASSPQPVIVNNTGNDFANVTGVSFSGPQATSFAISGASTGKVPANGSLTLDVVAVPLQLGPAAATMTILFDDPNNPMATVSLAVIGAVGKIMVQPALVDFGPQPVGKAAAPGSVTVTNVGTDVLTILGYTLTDPSGVFGSNQPIAPMTAIAPQASVTFDVQFTPAMAMAYAGHIDLTTDDPTAMLTRIPLDGVGATAAASVSPAMIDFPSTPVGMVATPQAVTITNTGGLGLSVQSIALGGAAAAAFAVDQTGPLTVAAGASQTVHVSFSPSMSGAADAMLTVDLVGVPQATVTLHGTGTAPMATASPQSLDFGMVTVGTASSPAVVGITNTGASAITFSAIAASDSAFTVDRSTTMATLMPGATTTFQVTFVPPATGLKSGSVSVSIQGQAQPLVAVPTSGTGIAAVVSQPGGCATDAGARESGPRLLLLVGGLLLAAAVRRRRAR